MTRYKSSSAFEGRLCGGVPSWDRDADDGWLHILKQPPGRKGRWYYDLYFEWYCVLFRRKRKAKNYLAMGRDRYLLEIGFGVAPGYHGLAVMQRGQGPDWLGPLEGLPAIDPAHGNLARGHQGPEQHGRGLRRRQGT